MLETSQSRVSAGRDIERLHPEAALVAPSATAAPPTLQRTIRNDQICILTFDRPGSSANIFDRETLVELNAHLDAIAGDSSLKALVLASAKRSIFVAGADLNMLSQKASPEEARQLIELGQSVMNRLAALRIPTVAAIHGAALGGGCELSLACDYRIASSDRATRIGLPETQLGLLPAWGGSTRLPRLIGLPKALDIILGGKSLKPEQALKRRLVDDVVPAEYLLQTAARWAGHGKPRSRRGAWRLAFVNNRLVGWVIAVFLRSRLLKKTRGHYPALPTALSVVTRGISKTVAESLALERDGILELLQTEACHNLIRLFFLQELAKKRALADTTSPLPLSGSPTHPLTPPPITRTAVIGAGVMGAGIAYWLSSRSLPVILRDINTEQVAKGMASIARLYQEGRKRRVFTSREARDGLDRLSPAPVEVPLRNVDLVIEAAVEKLEAKKAIFRALDDSVSAHTILATNTSALPVSELAAATRHPERILGLHFFNPVHRMQLVEIVAARQTSPAVLQRALRFVQHIGKLPVIVKDSPGFLVNRILIPYLIEAGNLFQAGASITDLDEAMLDFGMPMGPMRLLDEVGIDVAVHVAQSIAASFSDRMAVPAFLTKMVQAGLLGRKSSCGFYLYTKNKDPRPNPPVKGLLSSANSHRDFPSSELQERMVFLMVNEAARCLEEQIVMDPADIDFAMVMGTGFAPFRGGPLRYADALGAEKLVGAMEFLVDSGATHFAPCKRLRDMAASRAKFYQAG